MRRALIWLLLLGLPWLAWAGNSFNEPSATQEVQRYLGAALSPYVASGCLPTVPSSSLTFGAFACTAFLEDTQTPPRLLPAVQAAQAVTLANTNGQHWLAVCRDTTTTVSGWTRVTGSHYVHRQVTAKPVDPAGCQVIAGVTVAGSIITAVADHRKPSSYARAKVYDVTDPLYGAVGDCSTNNYAAFLAALTAGTGRRVYVPDPEPGSCYVLGTGTLTIPTNTWLIGANKRTTKLQHAVNAAMFAPADGAGLMNLYLEGDGDTYSGVALAFGGTFGRQVVQHMRMVNFRDNVMDFSTAAGSQSSFHDIEMNSWDATTHAAAATGSGKFAAVFDTAQQLSAVPRKFTQIETNGSPSFHFGGCNNTMVSDSFLGDLGFDDDSRSVHLSGIRLANQTTLTLYGHGNTWVNSSISPALTIDSTSDDWHLCGNVYNNPPIVDNTANQNNEICQAAVTYTPVWTATAGTAPALGNGILRGQYTRAGGLIHYSVELIAGSTTTFGDAGVWNFSTPAPYVGGVSPAVQVQNGQGYARDVDATTNHFVLPTIVNGTSVVVLRNSGSIGDVAFNQPFTWANTDILRFSVTYSTR